MNTTKADVLKTAFDEGRIDRMTYDTLNERFVASNSEGAEGATANVRSPESIWHVPEALEAVPWWTWILLLIGIAVFFKPKFLTRYL